MGCYSTLQKHFSPLQKESLSFEGVFQPFVALGEGEEGGAFLCRKARQLGKLLLLFLEQWRTCGTQILHVVDDERLQNDTSWRMSSLPCQCNHHLQRHMLEVLQPFHSFRYTTQILGFFLCWIAADGSEAFNIEK